MKRRRNEVGVLAAAALELYPPAWRSRYGDEVRALLEDSGGGPRAAVALVCHAIPAWLRPARHLYDRPGRMRASLSTVSIAWVVLAGLAAVFLQLAQLQGSTQGSTLAEHPVIGWSYRVFDGCLVVSVVAVVAGGVPLWLRMLRAAHRARRRRVLAGLLAPVVVPAAYLVVSVVVIALARRPARPVLPDQPRSVLELANGMVGPWWFLALVALGFGAAVVSAVGPGVALRGLRPQGRPVVLASRAAVVAAVTMGLAGLASVVAVVGLYVWAPAYAGYHEGWQLGVYLPVELLAGAVAVISAVRGARVTRTSPTA